METSEKPLEASWKKHKDWKNRYSKLYANHYLTKLQDKENSSCERISFMSNENAPYSELLMRVRANRRNASSVSPSPKYLTSLLSQQSDLYGTYTGTGSMLPRNSSQNSDSMNMPSSSYPSNDRSSYSRSSFGRSSNNLSSYYRLPSYQLCISEDLGGHETLLLDMVRARTRELEEEALDQPLDLNNEDSDGQISEPCIHGMSMRMTERSVSRSRVSRLSTRRDMDIPSILAFNASTTPPTHLSIPAFTNAIAPLREEIPRWSIRRAVCPVCSQKWKDRSSIKNIKNSGLKRNSSSELPSVIAPARLRSAITMGFVPRSAVTSIDTEERISNGGLRNSSASWQLTRARRFRSPKPQLPPPEARAPPKAVTPPAQRDLDLRVHRFLNDEEVK